ncbi:MAG: hypothetical protein QM784_33405 [Polyangiaceae bacterium]
MVKGTNRPKSSLRTGLYLRSRGVDCAMNGSVQIVGRVCLCEWEGAVSASTVATLLSQLREVDEFEGEPCILIINVSLSSAKSIATRASTFQDVMPALWAHCQEILVAFEGPASALGQLCRALSKPSATRDAATAHSLRFFTLLDEAFSHTQASFPHEALELRRRRIRSGAWCPAIKEAAPKSRVSGDS